jgi:hypothetical protein
VPIPQPQAARQRSRPTGKLLIGNLLRGGAFWLASVTFEEAILSGLCAQNEAGQLDVTF